MGGPCYWGTHDGHLGRCVATLQELDKYLKAEGFSGGQYGSGSGFCVIFHNYWVLRMLGTPSDNQHIPPLPTDTGGGYDTACAGRDGYLYGWPSKTTDKCVAKVPFISDECYSGYGTTARLPGTTADINNLGAHFYNGSLNSVNLGFADGHVELHNRSQITWQTWGVKHAAVWFY
jgi:prepilin-type processing-associated H-X9-DG protein